MKAITLTQPWATLIAIGAKKIETRSWATAYRGPLAIHAAKGLSAIGGKQSYLELCKTMPFWEALYGASLVRNKTADQDLMTLPFGAIVATCQLVAVYRIPATPQRFSRSVPDDHPLASYPVTLPPFQDDQERAFGDYTPRRYAWLLEDVKVLDAPIECKGALGLWEWKDK